MKKLLLFAFLLTGGFTSSLRADTVVVFNEIMSHPATNEPALDYAADALFLLAAYS